MYCDNCKHRKKMKFATLFHCDKFDKILKGNPPEKCAECLGEKENKKKPNRGYVEVK